MSPAPAPSPAEVVGRYALHGEIACGGMAVVHYGKLLGAMGFSRAVAIKRLLPQLARDPAVRAMFVDEARLVSRVRHPNVVPTLDVVHHGPDLLLVMEYVHGESLHMLLRSVRARGQRVPLRVVLAIATAVLHGLHAAHEATSEAGEPLGIVHRDVSPQNVLVGADGVTRVLDFGIARATVRLEHTADGIVKGKLAYMAPEQLAGGPVDRRADVYAASILLWEMLTGRRLFVQEDGGTVLVDKLLQSAVEPPSRLAPGIPRLLDAIVLHGLARNPEQRFPTAREMALALERVAELALPTEIGEWVQELAFDALAEREERLHEVERSSAPPVRERMESGERPTVRPPSPSPTAPLMTPHATMAVPMPPAPSPHRVLAVFLAYAALGAAIVLTVVGLRSASGGSSGHLPAPAAAAEHPGGRPPTPAAAVAPHVAGGGAAAQPSCSASATAGSSPATSSTCVTSAVVPTRIGGPQ